MSFRFGKKIADLASVFIREAKGEKGFGIKGNPEKSSRVAFYTELPRPKTGERCAILSRTNLALFEKALGLRSRGISFSLEGNIGAIIWRILDVYWLSVGEHDKIRDTFIQSFESLDSLEIYTRDLDDFQLAGMAKVVREYARILPDAIFDMLKISKNTTGNSNGPGIILSTVHGAKARPGATTAFWIHDFNLLIRLASATNKGSQVWARGQEYDRVYIDPDLAAALSRTPGLQALEFGDEANIAYVAFTRAIRELYLPRDFKDILTPEWQAAIKRYEPVLSPRTSKAPQLKHVRRASRGFLDTRSSQFMTEIPQSEAPREKPFKVGDRVRTSHGTGTVVEVDGDKYLVDLDGQEAQLWEKEWGLRKV